ncbi:uncharacterized protein [Epargyreus clarus]|uniref:uncharacterized protein n=1 Tax=Epargyreus clarus TaxID=520877 RepID=UPI003C2C7D63
MMEIEREEGEMSDNEMLVDDTPACILDDEKDCTVLYKAEKGGVVVKTLEKIDASKLEERAKRFGLNLCGNRVVTQKQIDELYSNCGIESGNERHFRFDTLHLNGVEGLTTKEIFEYLEDYKPVSLEWIDDTSCNIVCQDHISAALALLVHSREIQNEELKGISNKSSHHWREGMPHPKVDTILMRFATNGDKKIGKKKAQVKRFTPGNANDNTESSSKNPWGDLCKSWGVYDHQEVFQRKLPKNDYEEDSEETTDVVQIKNKKLAMRLGKRSHNTDENEDSSSDSEWKKKSKTPRMRMHADDEESKRKKNLHIEPIETADSEAYAPLSIEVVNTKIAYTPRDAPKLSDKFRSHNKPHGHAKSHNVRSRLGAKITPLIEEYSSSDSSSSEDSDYNEHTMSRVQKVDNNLVKSSVWSRLEEKPREQSDQRDLRHILKSKKQQKKPDDLRDRLGKSKQSNLRIEIDNDVLN